MPLLRISGGVSQHLTSRGSNEHRESQSAVTVRIGTLTDFTTAILGYRYCTACVRSHSWQLTSFQLD